METHAVITVGIDAAELRLGKLTAQDPYAAHGGKDQTIRYLFALAVRQGAATFEKITKTA